MLNKIILYDFDSLMQRVAQSEEFLNQKAKQGSCLGFYMGLSIDHVSTSTGTVQSEVAFRAVYSK